MRLGDRVRSVGALVAVGMAAYQIYVVAFGAPPAYLFRVVHLVFAIVAVYLIGKKGASKVSSAVGLVLAALSAAALTYLIVQYPVISTRYPYVSPLSALDMAMGVVVILLTLEATRRFIGETLPVLVVLFLVFAFVGHLLPGMLNHPKVSLMQLIDQQVFTSEGIFGVPLDASAAYIAIFIIFGSFLEASGAGRFYIDLATRVAGKGVGGPGKVAVFSSALLGTITGSPVSNVVTTGTFTIPLMKKSGFDPTVAAAVEASASTGSMIMPPVMGAAAFILAAYIGVPYSTVALASILPAALYYLGIYVMVDLQARKGDLGGINISEMAPWKELLKSSYLFLPVLMLIVALMQGMTIGRAALFAIVGVILLSWVRPESRLGPRRIYEALRAGGEQAAGIAVTTACAGLVVGVVTLTGFGVKVATLLTTVADGNLALALVMAMVASLILGMGLPPTAVYVVEAAVVVPGLVRMGLAPLHAHLFVFYFSQFSAITPPVALAAFAAAGVAGTNFVKTGFMAMKIGFAAYLVPFLFIYRPALLLGSSAWETIWHTVVAAVAVAALAAGFQGWGLVRLSWLARLLMFFSAILLIAPGLWADLAGFGALAVALAVHVMVDRRRATTQVIENTATP